MQDPNAPLKQLQMMAQMVGKDPTDDRVLAAMAQNIGMSSEEFRALAIADQARGSEEVQQMKKDAYWAGHKEDSIERAWMSGRGLDNTGFGGFMDFGRWAVEGVSGAVVAPIVEGAGELIDATKRMFTESAGFYTADEMAVGRVNDEGVARMMTIRQKETKENRWGDEYSLPSEEYDGLISQVQQLAISGDEDAYRIMEMIRDGDAEGAREAIAALDKKTDGKLLGKDKADFRKEVELEKIQKDIEKGDLYIEERGTVDTEAVDEEVDQIDKTLRTAGMDDKKLEEATRSAEVQERLGIKEGDMEGMSEAARKAYRVDLAKEYLSEEKDELTDVGVYSNREVDQEQFFARLEERGIETEQAMDYIQKSGIDVSSWVKSNTGWFEDETENLNRLAEQIKSGKAGEPAKEESSGTVWDDLMTGISDSLKSVASIGDGASDNAIKDLTKATKELAQEYREIKPAVYKMQSERVR